MTHEEALRGVLEAMSRDGMQVEMQTLNAGTIMSSDAGIDVYDFAVDLERMFGPVARTVPWEQFSDQGASFYGCLVILVPFWFLRRFMTWPMHRELIPRPDDGREALKACHLAEVMRVGEWFEPSSSE